MSSGDILQLVKALRLLYASWIFQCKNKVFIIGKIEVLPSNMKVTASFLGAQTSHGIARVKNRHLKNKFFIYKFYDINI